MSNSLLKVLSKQPTQNAMGEQVCDPSIMYFTGPPNARDDLVLQRRQGLTMTYAPSNYAVSQPGMAFAGAPMATSALTQVAPMPGNLNVTPASVPYNPYGSNPYAPMPVMPPGQEDKF